MGGIVDVRMRQPFSGRITTSIVSVACGMILFSSVASIVAHPSRASVSKMLEAIPVVTLMLGLALLPFARMARRAERVLLELFPPLAHGVGGRGGYRALP